MWHPQKGIRGDRGDGRRAAAFIDCACLTMLIRHCEDIKSQGGSFALAGPESAVHRLLAVTGLLTWFDVDDTVEEAGSRAGTQSSPVLPAIAPAGRPRRSVLLRPTHGQVPVAILPTGSVSPAGTLEVLVTADGSTRVSARGTSRPTVRTGRLRRALRLWMCFGQASVPEQAHVQAGDGACRRGPSLDEIA